MGEIRTPKERQKAGAVNLTDPRQETMRATRGRGLVVGNRRTGLPI